MFQKWATLRGLVVGGPLIAITALVAALGYFLKWPQLLWAGFATLTAAWYVITLPMAMFEVWRDDRKASAAERDSLNSALKRERAAHEAELAKVTGEVALHMVYVNQRFEIHNDGKTNLRLWGTRFSDQIAVIEYEPRIIAPTSFYFLDGERFEREVKEKVLVGTTGRVRCKLFLTNALDEPYVATFWLFVTHKQEGPTVNTQLVGLALTDWRE